MRPCASSLPSLGSTAISILCVEWLCTQERLNPEAVIIFGEAARSDGLQLAAVMITRIRKILRCTRGQFVPTRLCGESLLHIAPYGPWQFASVRNASSFFLKKNIIIISYISTRQGHRTERALNSH